MLIYDSVRSGYVINVIFSIIVTHKYLDLKKNKKNSHLEHSKPSHLEPQYLEHPIYVLSVSV